MKVSKSVFSKLCYLFLVLILSKAGTTDDIASTDWKHYIPLTGKPIQADVMELGTSQELQILSGKLQESLKKNPEWALKFLKSAPKGQPLPYHENLGLTKQEYTRMLDLIQSAVTLTKTGTIDLVFLPSADGRVKIVTTKDSPLNNLIISPEKVETIWGELATVTPIHQQDAKSLTGPWKGIKWGKNTVNEKTLKGDIIQFCIGKCENKDQGIIYYDGKILKGTTTPPTQFTHILYFPLPKKG